MRHSIEGSQDQESSSSPPARRPLVFISHDSRDAFLGRAFADLLKGVTGGALRTFCSADARGAAGIEFGVEWYPKIISKLEEATDVVVLLTPKSLDRSWIMFEAGVARGIGKAHIFAVTVGVDAEQTTSGPFYLFQNCGAEEKALKQLVKQLIARNLQSEPLGRAVKLQVRDFRGKIDAWTRKRQNESSRLLGPKLLTEFPLYPPGGKGEYDCTGWLMLIGTLRDELPWFFELGLELHRALTDGDEARIAGAKERVLGSLRTAARNDWLRSVLADSNRELTFRLFHLPDIVEDYLRVLEPAKKANPGRVRKAQPLRD